MMKLSPNGRLARTMAHNLHRVMADHQRAYDRLEALKEEIVAIEKTIHLITDMQKLLPQAAIAEYEDWCVWAAEDWDRRQAAKGCE